MRISLKRINNKDVTLKKSLLKSAPIQELLKANLNSNSNKSLNSKTTRENLSNINKVASLNTKIRVESLINNSRDQEVINISTIIIITRVANLISMERSEQYVYL